MNATKNNNITFISFVLLLHLQTLKIYTQN